MESSFLFVAALATAFLSSVAANRWLKVQAPRMGLIDWPGERRRVHTRPTAVVGGLGLLIAIGLTGGIVLVGSDVTVRYPGQFSSLLPVLGGGVAMCLVGLWDDRQKLPWGVKFGFQVLVSLAVVLGGVRMGTVEVPFLGIVELAGPVSIGLSVFWLVGITNAFNLVDGTDGLAAGAAMMSILAMFVVSLVLGHELIALFLGITGAATLGFLHYNFPPASIFLGDSGSQMLGFLLAGLGVVGSTKAATAVVIAVPVVAFGLPVLDTALAIVRRFLRGDPITQADRGHIHHRLIDLGHSPRRVVLLLYGACGVFAAASLVALSPGKQFVGPVFVTMLLGVGYGLHRLRIPELLELGRLWDHEGGIRPQINRNVQIRARARELEEKESLPGIFAILSAALAATEYDGLELWIHRNYLRQIPSAVKEIERGALVGVDDGFLWRWTRSSVTLERYDKLELRAPVLVAEEGVAAEVTIRRDMETKIPGGLAVLSDSLLPATARALRNARNVGAVGRIQVEAPFTHVETADTRLRTASG